MDGATARVVGETDRVVGATARVIDVHKRGRSRFICMKCRIEVNRRVRSSRSTHRDVDFGPFCEINCLVYPKDTECHAYQVKIHLF
jgi:hypothetical protein